MANKDKIEKLDELIKDIIDGELIEQEVTSLLPLGENYGSVMYKVDFKVKKDSQIVDYHAVAKCTPLNTITQEIFNTQKTFKSEIGWYTTVIPTLKKFAKDQGLEREIDFFQKFYGARISLNPNSEKVDLDGVILTENLKYRGYKNVDRHVGFDLPATYSVLKDLATFHAVPLAIRQLDPEKFNLEIKPFLPTWSSCTEEQERVLKQPVFAIYEHLPEFKPIMDWIKERVNDSVIFQQREIREPWITALHLDFWSNNIMITEGSNCKTIILDLQCPGYGSPAADLIFFLLTSVKNDVIENEFHDFLKYYHEELLRNLEELRVDTEQFSFKAFMKELDVEAKSGALAHALSHLHFIFLDKGVSTMDVSDENFKYEDFKSNDIPVSERHIERYRWITKQALELGYYNIDRHIGFDRPTTISVIKDLATFHAVTLALRLKDKSLFEKNVAAFCPEFGAIDDEMKKVMDKGLLDTLKEIPELEPYQDSISTIITESYPFLPRKLREPWVSVVHRDFWCNNIMVTGGEDSKNIILDLQVPTVGSPVVDLLLLLLTSVSTDVIQDNFDKFTKFYYEEFIENLRQLQVDVSNYDFEDFLKEIKTETKVGEFAHALGHSQIIMMDKGFTPFDSSDAEFAKEKENKEFTMKPTPKQIEKLKWIAQEVIKQNWI